MTHLIYALGTVVRAKSDPKGEPIVIHEVSATFEIGTHYGAGGAWWYDHDDLELISEPTDESIAAAMKVAHDEDSEDEEEDEG